MTTPDLAAAERIIRGRRATRAFLADPVPAATMTAIFDLASTAPSNSNTQPWTVEVVSGGVRDDLGRALVRAAEQGAVSPDFPVQPYTGVAAQRSFRAGALMYGALGVERGDAAGRRRVFLDGLRFYGAPHVALLYVPGDADQRAAADLGIYAQTLMLAMAAHGVDSCPQGAVGVYAEAVRTVLGPTSNKLLFGVSFGYADPDRPGTTVDVPRAPLPETTTFHG